MRRDSNRISRGKTTADLKAELDRVQREEAKLAKQRAALDVKLAKAAEQAENSPPSTSGKGKKSPKPKGKRKWKEGRPSVPYPDFPLSPHASGKWMKKIRGDIHYFGRWAKRVNGKLVRIEGDGWKDALELYKAQADDLHAGRTPRAVSAEGLTVADLCNRFLTAKKTQCNSGEITDRTFAEYQLTTDRLIETFGSKRIVADLDSADFEKLRKVLAEQYGPTRLGTEIQKVRTAFKFSFEAGLIDKPVRFGPMFVKPSKSVMRKHRAKTGSKMFTPSEILALLNGSTKEDDNEEEVKIPGASIQLRAMILLALNCGFGNGDCGSLPMSAVDLKKGWIEFPRPKTGIQRRCPLWKETIAALQKVFEIRVEPRNPDDADIVFLTKYRKRWVRTDVRTEEDERTKIVNQDSIALEFGKLMRAHGFNGNRGFYALRHTFRTVADATRDFPAVRLIMGHADHSIDDVYREHIENDRLVAVVNQVHGWLFGAKNGGGK